MGRSDQAAFAELKNHHKGWLSSLEETVEFEGLLFCHGTPDNDHVYLCETVEPDGRVRLATRAEITRRLAGVQVPIVLCGHSHMVRYVALDHDRLVVNPGSVGLPAYTDGEPVTHSMQMGAPHARYAVLERRRRATRGRSRSASSPMTGRARPRAPPRRTARTGRTRSGRGMRLAAHPERQRVSRIPGPPAWFKRRFAATGSATSPLASKIRTISAKPRRLACCSGVTLSRSAMLTLAPASTSSRTISVCTGPPSPRITASSSAVQPSLLT